MPEWGHNAHTCAHYVTWAHPREFLMCNKCQNAPIMQIIWHMSWPLRIHHLHITNSHDVHVLHNVHTISSEWGNNIHILCSFWNARKCAHSAECAIIAPLWHMSWPLRIHNLHITNSHDVRVLHNGHTRSPQWANHVMCPFFLAHVNITMCTFFSSKNNKHIFLCARR